MSIALSLFLAGLLTILLPCILPLIPIVLGVSVTDRNRWRPLVTILGMLVSFVGFTFLLQVVLSRFVVLADFIRIGTFYVLLLFGLGFLTGNRVVHIAGAVLGSLFFLGKDIPIAGWSIPSAPIAAVIGIIGMVIGGRIATRIQQLGTNIQEVSRSEFGAASQLTAFIVGLTMGLVWVPCAGPALGFALTLVRDEPGPRALLYLLLYGLGTAIPLLLIGYGGQSAVKYVRFLNRYTGTVKHVSGVALILTAIALRLDGFTQLQVLVADSWYGTFGTKLEQRIIGDPVSDDMNVKAKPMPTPSELPVYGNAPELVGLGPWHNSGPLTMEQLRGKVVLVDFWTYSCINCIRTLPYLKAYWEKYKDQPFVLLGVHTPEFVFEKSQANVATAVAKHGLTYPIAQDNDYGTWRAFENRYWPAKYLIDAEGRIRYYHFGEGAYDETDEAIAELLREIGEENQTGITVREDRKTPRRGQSPETYLGSRSFVAFANKSSDTGSKIVTYRAPDTLPLHQYALEGTWELLDDEREVLHSPAGEIRMRFQGGEINLVLGLEDDADPVEADVFIDNRKVKTLTIREHDLYELFRGSYGEHDLILKFRGRGVAAYAFTFGG